MGQPMSWSELERLVEEAEAETTLQRALKHCRTQQELVLAARLARKCLCWEGHASDLPGLPDFVFRDARVAVFVGGDFWHGW